ncbi:MAG: twin-arginine translocase TatA/TatE family subunit [Candidatus Dormibacteria bacterium]
MLGDRWLLLAVLMLLALVVFGPKRLPELGHSLGRALHNFRKASQAVADETGAVTIAATPEEPVGDRSGDAASGQPVGTPSGRSDPLPPPS